MLARVAASHIRVGTFEYFAARNDTEALRLLVDYTLKRHYPAEEFAGNAALALLDKTLERQARLLAQWMLVGFIHGVMNTDNMAISGETIDYGPCAFLDTYDPDAVFSSIDHSGRYAYCNQPTIAKWNLSVLAESLLPLIDAETKQAREKARAMLETFDRRYAAHWSAGMQRKLGFGNVESGDEELGRAFLKNMHQQQLDYTNTFAALESSLDGASLFAASDSLWEAQWRARVARQPSGARAARQLMRAANPRVIPRNHQLERAIQSAYRGDYSVMERLIAVLAQPYQLLAENDEYSRPPCETERVRQTFCGT